MNTKSKFKQTEIGMIPEDWEVKELKDIADFKNGKSSPERNDDKEFFVYGSNGVIGKSDKTNSEEETIIIGRVGSYCGSVYLSTNKCWVTDNAIIGKAKENASSSFLFYLLKKLKLNDRRTGSGQPLLNQSILNSIKIPLIDKKEQHSIAKILSDLDSKIELNQQMNKTLEAIGQAIFKRWFVDFEFPNEEGRPYKSSGGEMILDAESGKEIPKDWEVRQLGKFVKLERGLSYNGKGLSKLGTPMINLGTISPNKNFIYEGLKYYSGDYKARNLVKPGDLVIANTDITQDRVVLGSPSIVPPDLGSESILFTHHIYAIRNNSEISNLFFFYLLKTREYKGRVKGFASGTTVLALPEDAVLDLSFVVPIENILKKFNGVMNDIKDKTFTHVIENRSLSQIRDSLLPRLMSGKIRVPVEVRA